MYCQEIESDVERDNITGGKINSQNKELDMERGDSEETKLQVKR